MQKVFCLLACFIMLTACSNKGLYEIGQNYQKSECIKKAQTEAQYHECIRAEPKPYEQYEKERQAVIKK